MKHKQEIIEVDDDTINIVSTSTYNREEYRRLFAPQLAIERIWNENMITADYCIEGEDQE